MHKKRYNYLNQGLDIGGTKTKRQTSILAEEDLSLGNRVPGQAGTGASITTYDSVNGLLTVTNVSGMTTLSLGRFLTVSGASNSANNGSFPIHEIISDSEIRIWNTNGIANDSNNGSISWIERYQYTLQSDLNYVRTDRKLIKGTSNYYDAVPTYLRPNNTAAPIPANLANIAGKTTDAKTFILNRKAASITITTGADNYLLADTGNLLHSTSSNILGIPTFDSGPDVGNHTNTYVEILNNSTGESLSVKSGTDAGKKIFGRTIATGATSPNSITIKFYAVGLSESLALAVPYTWESDQTSVVNFYYGYRERLDLIDENAFRSIGGGSGAGGSGSTSAVGTSDILPQLISDGTLIYFASTVVSTDFATKKVTINISPDGYGLVNYDIHRPIKGDKVYINNSSGSFADGYYTIDSIIDDTNLTVAQTIASSSGGNIYLIYPPGATKIGFDPTSLSITSGKTVQEALYDIGIVAQNALSAQNHASLQELIHFIDDGPADGFASNAYREVLGQPFPSSITWYADSSKTKKIVEKIITRNAAKMPTSVQWNMYGSDGTTILHSVIDNISYTSNIFESNRTRIIS